jgi:uncharacterized protein YxjI
MQSAATIRSTPSAPPARTDAPKTASDVFDRSRFFLRQKHFAISEKYFVWSEHEEKLLFVERPAHLGRRLLMVVGAVASFIVTVLLVIAVFTGLNIVLGAPGGVLKDVSTVAAPILGLAAMLVTIMALMPKRHVTFYRDDTKKEPLLRVEQDRKFQFLTATYTVKDAAGAVLARLSKNYLYNVIRKRWYCHDAKGALLSTIKEDSIILSIARRLLGPMLGILRTNFVFLSGETQIGKFDRQFTLFDRYVLDVSDDTKGVLDRRVALAIGVMLDTGEKR